MSVKNVQLVQTDVGGTPRRVAKEARRSCGTSDVSSTRIAWIDDRQRASRQRDLSNVECRGGKTGGAGDVQLEVLRAEPLLFSFWKVNAEEFALEFRWPMSPLQAFGLALASLDTTV